MEELSDVSFFPTPISKPSVGGSKTVDLLSTARPLAPRIPLSGLSQGQAQARSFLGQSAQQHGGKVSSFNAVSAAARETTPKTLRQLEAYNEELERLTNSPATSAALSAPTPITAWGLSRKPVSVEGALDRRENLNNNNGRNLLSPLDEQLNVDVLEEVNVEEEIVISEGDEHSPLLLNGGITGSDWEGIQFSHKRNELDAEIVNRDNVINEEGERGLNEDKHVTPLDVSPRHTIEELLEPAVVAHQLSDAVEIGGNNNENRSSIDVESDDSQIMTGSAAQLEIESYKRNGMIHIIPSAPLLLIQELPQACDEEEDDDRVKHCTMTGIDESSDGRLLIDDLTTTRADFTTVQGLTRGPPSHSQHEDVLLNQRQGTTTEERGGEEGRTSTLRSSLAQFTSSPMSESRNIFTESAVVATVADSSPSLSLSRLAMGDLDSCPKTADHERESSSSSSSPSSSSSYSISKEDGATAGVEVAHVSTTPLSIDLHGESKNNTPFVNTLETKSNSAFKCESNVMEVGAEKVKAADVRLQHSEDDSLSSFTRSNDKPLALHEPSSMSTPVLPPPLVVPSSIPISLQIPASLSSLSFLLTADVSQDDRGCITSWRHTPTAPLPYQQSATSSGGALEVHTLDARSIDLPLRNSGSQAIHLKLSFSHSMLTLTNSKSERISCTILSETFISAMPQSIVLEPSSIGRTSITLSAASLVKSVSTSSLYRDLFEQKDATTNTSTTSSSTLILREAALALRLDLDAADGAQKPLSVPIRISVTFKSSAADPIVMRTAKNTSPPYSSSSLSAPQSYPILSSSGDTRGGSVSFSSSFPTSSSPILNLTNPLTSQLSTSSDLSPPIFPNKNSSSNTGPSSSLVSPSLASSNFVAQHYPVSASSVRPASASDFAKLPDLRGGGGGDDFKGQERITAKAIRPASAPPVHSVHVFHRENDDASASSMPALPVSMASSIATNALSNLHAPLALMPRVRVPSHNTSAPSSHNMPMPQSSLSRNLNLPKPTESEPNKNSTSTTIDVKKKKEEEELLLKKDQVSSLAPAPSILVATSMTATVSVASPPEKRRSVATRFGPGVSPSATSSALYNTRKSTRIPLSPPSSKAVPAVPPAASTLLSSASSAPALIGETSKTMSTTSSLQTGSTTTSNSTPVKKSAFSSSRNNTLSSSSSSSLTVPSNEVNSKRNVAAVMNSYSQDVDEEIESNQHEGSSSRTPVQLALKLPKSIPMNQDKRGGMFALAAAAASASTSSGFASTSVSASSSLHHPRSSSASAKSASTTSLSPAEKKKAMSQRASSIGATTITSLRRIDDDKPSTETMTKIASSSTTLPVTYPPSSTSASSTASAAVVIDEKKRRRKTLSTKSAREEKNAVLPPVPSSASDIFPREGYSKAISDGIASKLASSSSSSSSSSSVSFSPMAVTRPSSNHHAAPSSFGPRSWSQPPGPRRSNTERASTSSMIAALKVRPLPYLRATPTAAFSSNRKIAVMRDAATSPAPPPSVLFTSETTTATDAANHQTNTVPVESFHQQQKKQRTQENRDLVTSAFTGFAIGQSKQNGVMSTASKSRSRVFASSPPPPPSPSVHQRHPFSSGYAAAAAASPPPSSLSKRPPLHKHAHDAMLKSPSALVAEAVATSVLSPSSSSYALSSSGDLTQYSFIVAPPSVAAAEEEERGAVQPTTLNSLQPHLSPASASSPPLAQSRKRRTNIEGEPWGWTNNKGLAVEKSQQQSQQRQRVNENLNSQRENGEYSNGFVWEANQQKPLSVFGSTHMTYNTQQNGFIDERPMPDFVGEDHLLFEAEQGNNVPVRTRIDLFGSSSSSSSSSSSMTNTQPLHEIKQIEVQHRSEVLSVFESAMDMMNETIPNDVTGEVHVDDHQHDAEGETANVANIVHTHAERDREDGEEEEEEVTEEHNLVLNSANDNAGRCFSPPNLIAATSNSSSSDTTSMLFAPVFADLIDAHDAEHIVAEEQEQELRASASSPDNMYLHNSRPPSSSFKDATSSCSISISMERSMSPNHRNNSAFDKTIPVHPLTSETTTECSTQSDRTAVWTSSSSSPHDVVIPNSSVTSEVAEAAAATPTIIAFADAPRLRDSQLGKARPAQAPSHPSNILGHTPRVMMMSSHKGVTESEGGDEKLLLTALDSVPAPINSATTSATTPFLHSSFGFNDSRAGSSSRFNPHLTLSSMTSSYLSSSDSYPTSQSTWFVTVDSLSLQLPLPSPFASGPDGTNFSTSINVKNGSSNNLRVTVFGPANTGPLLLSTVQDAQFEEESVSDTLNGSRLSSPLLQARTAMTDEKKSESQSSDNKDGQFKASSLWQPLTLVSQRTTPSSSSPFESRVESGRAENVTVIPPRSFGQIHVRFALPETGRRVDMRGWTYNDEKRAASASIFIGETANHPEATTTTVYSAQQPSHLLSRTINLQTVKITVAESAWRNLGYSFDAASNSLYSTGEVLSKDDTMMMFNHSSASSVKSNHPNSYTSRKRSSANASSVPFMSPSIASLPTGGFGPRLPLGIGLSSVLQSPPRPVLTSSLSFAANTNNKNAASPALAGSPKHERILLPSNSSSSCRLNLSSNHQIVPTSQHDVREIPAFPSLHAVASMHPPEMMQMSSSHMTRTAQRSTQKVAGHGQKVPIDDHFNYKHGISSSVNFEGNNALSSITFDDMTSVPAPTFSSFVPLDLLHHQQQQHSSEMLLLKPPADKPKARTGLGPFASPPGTSTVSSSTIVMASSSSSSGALSSSSRSSGSVSSPGNAAPGVRFPMRTLIFPADSNVIKVELSNTSQTPLRVRARLTCPGVLESALQKTPFFHLKKNHMEFELLPRRYVLIPVSFKPPTDEESGEKSSHACTLIVEAANENVNANFQGLTLKSKVLLVKE